MQYFENETPKTIDADEILQDNRAELLFYVSVHAMLQESNRADVEAKLQEVIDLMNADAKLAIMTRIRNFSKLH